MDPNKMGELSGKTPGGETKAEHQEKSGKDQEGRGRARSDDSSSRCVVISFKSRCVYHAGVCKYFITNVIAI